LAATLPPTTIAPSATAAAEGDALPALPRGATDVSATSTGRDLTEKAVARNPDLKAAGRLRVVRDDAGYLVAPASTRFVALPLELPDGSIGTELAPLTQAPTVAVALAMQAPGTTALLAERYWSRVASDCFARISDDWAWMDHCYHMFKEINDGSSTYD